MALFDSIVEFTHMSSAPFLVLGAFLLSSFPSCLLFLITPKHQGSEACLGCRFCCFLSSFDLLHNFFLAACDFYYILKEINFFCFLFRVFIFYFLFYLRRTKISDLLRSPLSSFLLICFIVILHVYSVYHMELFLYSRMYNNTIWNL